MRLAQPFLACLALAAAVAAPAARADDIRAGDIRVERPWARATAGNSRIGAAYFTLEDVGAAPDRLVRVESTVARAAELHAHTMVDNVMQMRPVAAVEVNPGTPTVLQPGGLHVMLLDLTAPLKAGDRFQLTLEFERSGRVEITVPIESAGARGPQDGDADKSVHHGAHGS